jgi:ubiquinone/menaquinone biosynthesis C-methylase UbiE
VADDTPPDLQTVTQVQQQIWSRGDFAKIGTSAQMVAEELCEAIDVLPGRRVLDVACGAGNGAIAAARRNAEAVGLDYVPALLDRARERAAAERYDIEFVEGDAQALPFEDGSFDYVISTFGAMFAPDQEKTASELLRVCRSGGKIGMANWPPRGLVGGGVFKVTAEHAAPPPGVLPPVLWGTEERLRELFGDGVSELTVNDREWMFRYHSPEQWLEFFREYFGPMITAFERVGEDGAQALESDLLETMREANRAGDAAMIAPAAYAEVVAVRA